jgi:anti-anti-sigma factor
VEVAGEVDMHTAERLGETLVTASDGRPERLILDLSAVGFIDSIGLSVVAQSAKKLLAVGGAFEIVCADSGILRVFEITGLRDILTFHPTRAEALAD